MRPLSKLIETIAGAASAFRQNGCRTRLAPEGNLDRAARLTFGNRGATLSLPKMRGDASGRAFSDERRYAADHVGPLDRSISEGPDHRSAPPAPASSPTWRATRRPRSLHHARPADPVPARDARSEDADFTKTETAAIDPPRRRDRMGAGLPVALAGARLGHQGEAGGSRGRHRGCSRTSSSPTRCRQAPASPSARAVREDMRLAQRDARADTAVAVTWVGAVPRSVRTSERPERPALPFAQRASRGWMAARYVGVSVSPSTRWYERG